ncbi:hypothetical protein, partial [Variovorax boronicumulans]|uniref:hypothetical protein n=1 Tax=Variovorax boronicumulans TaxID=436515 RepID=UPI0027D8F666
LIDSGHLAARFVSMHTIGLHRTPIGDLFRPSLEEKYRSALWEIERFGGVKELVMPNAPPIPFFNLREGDTARLRSGNHDWCDIVGERRDGVLGVEITAFNRQVGLPLRTVTRFATD